MKRIIVRSLICLILTAMLLSALPFATLAADYTYDANKLNACYDAGGKKSSGASFSNKYLANGYIQVKFQNDLTMNYFALLLEDVADGTYTAKFTFTGKTNAGAKVYAIPKSELPDSVTSSSSQRNDLLNSKTPVSFDRMTAEDGTGSASVTLTFSGDADKDYYLVFTPKLPDGQTSGFLRIGSLELTKGGSTPAPTTPAPTTPAPTTPAPTTPAPTTPAATEPATEPSTTPATEPGTTPATTPATNAPTTAPADNTGADEGSFPVAAIVAIVVVVIAGAAAAVIFLKKKKA